MVLVSPLVHADERLKDIACRSVHLSYPAVGGVAFYNEIAVDRSAPGTYFMVCGWDKGYFGMQELGNGKKLLLFSVWDSNQNDPKAVAADKRDQLLHKDDKVRIGRFGGEGTGGQAFFDYPWKDAQTYRFLVTAKADGERTQYAGWFYVSEDKSWKRLVTFSAVTGGKLLRGYYSFIEDFKRDRVSATKVRSAHFGNGWVQSQSGEWQPLARARFTADRNPVLNINAARDGERFLLATGGNTTNKDVKLQEMIELPPGGNRTPPETLPIHPAPGTITVAADGSGDFKTVQAAIDSVAENNKQPITIRIKPGTYKERIRVPKSKPFVTLLGDDAKTTVLIYDLHAKSVLSGESKQVGTSGSYSTFVEADDFTAENLTFENPSGHIAQAVALRLTGNRQAFFKCRMLGGQDTLFLHEGLAYFKDCYIEGRVDFIFGRGIAAFEDCRIHSKDGGYVTAAATEPGKEFGYLFLRCKLTGDGAKAFLGRPWRPHAAVAFLHCEIGDHIRPEGWDNWRKAENEKTARYVEFGNTGPGADTSKRVAWAKRLRADEAARYTVENVLGAWKPARPVSR